MNIVYATDQASPGNEAFKGRIQSGLSNECAVKRTSFRSIGLAAAAVLVFCGMVQFSLGAQSTKPEGSQSTTNKAAKPALVWAQLPTTLKFSHATHVGVQACSDCH